MVRCVAVSNSRFLASGSSDEAIKLIDLKRRRDFGTLVHHEGNFYDSHLTLAYLAENERLSIFRLH